MNRNRNTANAIAQFQTRGAFRSCEPYGNGHINDTFLVIFEDEGREVWYILQALNTNVFKKPEQVMANIEKVTEYLRGIIAEAGGDTERETLTLVPALDGKRYMCIHCPEKPPMERATFIEFEENELL